MTAQELIQSEIDYNTRMFRQALKDLPESDYDARLNEHAMSPREMVAHMTECYLAMAEEARGEKHSWGSYVPADNTVSGLWAAYDSAVEQGKAAAATDDGEILTKAHHFGPSHDAYHVGQLVTLRLTLTPDWNSYSIYD